MTLEEKLIGQRRKAGMSQEQLAYRLGVTRQSVSKWESGSAVPELPKLVQISELFGVSVDYLVKDYLTSDPAGSQTAEKEVGEGAGKGAAGEKAADDPVLEEMKELYRKAKGYSYTSKRKVLGIPLVSVQFNSYAGRGCPMAKGIIAIGNVALGVVALGGVSFGIVSAGIVGIGLLALGGVATGGLAIGGVSMGGVALGIVSSGIYALGWIAAGVRADGMFAAELLQYMKGICLS